MLLLFHSIHNKMFITISEVDNLAVSLHLLALLIFGILTIRERSLNKFSLIHFCLLELVIYSLSVLI